MLPMLPESRSHPPSGITSRQGIVAIVDDYPCISRALGMWIDLHDLRATHHTSAESLILYTQKARMDYD